MTTRVMRSVTAGLMVLATAGCATSWQPVTGDTRAYIDEQGPASVRVVRPDSSRVELSHPLILRDTIFGFERPVCGTGVELDCVVPVVTAETPAVSLAQVAGVEYAQREMTWWGRVLVGAAAVTVAYLGLRELGEDLEDSCWPSTCPG